MNLNLRREAQEDPPIILFSDLQWLMGEFETSEVEFMDGIIRNYPQTKNDLVDAVNDAFLLESEERYTRFRDAWDWLEKYEWTDWADAVMVEFVAKHDVRPLATKYVSDWLLRGYQDGVEDPRHHDWQSFYQDAYEKLFGKDIRAAAELGTGYIYYPEVDLGMVDE